MTDKLRAVVEHDGDTSVVKLAGFLDEDNNLKGLVEMIPAGTAMIDLAGVERINSCGIRDWVNWLAALEANGTVPVLVSCSPPIVAQINLVKNFTGGGAVKSFQVPYHCRECDEEKILLVETAEMTTGSAAPTCLCDSCGHAMDLDEMPESYFAFLATVPRPDEVARGSSAQVVKPRVKTRERRSSPPQRRSYPSLSAFQSPTPGVSRNSDKLLAKRPSEPRMALGSSERISGNKISSQKISTSRLDASTRTSAPMVEPRSNNGMVIALVVLLLAAIAALGYLVLTQ